MSRARLRETTSYSGAIVPTTSLTLLGAVAQYGLISGRVLANNPATVEILDAGGSVWLEAKGTLVDATHFTVDSLIDGSSGLRQSVTLTSGTHKIFVTLSSDDFDKRMVFADAFIDYVASGLVLPNSSGTLAGTCSAGTAYVIGRRQEIGAQAHTYTASKDTYVDLDYDGNLVYQAVTIAAAAPSLTANAIRLGFVTTGASTITGATVTGKDSLGNWMSNHVPTPFCSLAIAYNASITGAPGGTAVSFNSAGHEKHDNDGMHSIGTNPTRVTAMHARKYSVSGSVQWANGAGGLSAGEIMYAQINLGGTLIEGTQISTRANTGDFPSIPTFWSGWLNVNDYIELAGYNGGAGSETIVRANFYVEGT